MSFEVRGVSRSYATPRGPLEALAPTSFEVRPGDFVSLVGPSGCGKSTLLHICAGLQAPTAGGVFLDGQQRVGPGRERGMVFQNYTLFPWLTVRENVRFSHQLQCNIDYERPVAEILAELEYADHLLDIMGLSKFSQSHPHELSGGMKQRVAIARALANNPRILLMDEPFGALDAQTREDMQELMLLLAVHERATVLFVTHDIEEAAYLSNRILVFSAHPGKIIAEIDVPFPRDRSLKVKLDPDFFALKRQLMDLLHQGGRTGFDRETLLRRIRGH